MVPQLSVALLTFFFGFQSISSLLISSSSQIHPSILLLNTSIELSFWYGIFGMLFFSSKISFQFSICISLLTFPIFKFVSCMKQYMCGGEGEVVASLSQGGGESPNTLPRSLLIPFYQGEAGHLITAS